MRHVQRLGLGAMFIMAILILGLVIDTAVVAMIDVNKAHGVQNGPFGAVIGHIEGVGWSIVPIMLMGVVLWIVYGAIREERVEEKRRRVR
jgi:hypothetical protein